MAKSKRTIGIDIGTTKIASVMTEYDQNGRCRIIGTAMSSADGFRNGLVINLEKAVSSVANCIEQIQQITNISPRNCLINVGICGDYIKYINSVGNISVKNSSRGITSRDIEEVLQQAQTIKLPPDEQIIHLFPIQYIVDGQKGIRNPLGMFGVRLEVEALLVMGTITALENIERVLEHLDLRINSLILQPQAIANLVAEPEELNLGVAIVDLGGITNIAIFKDGVLRYYKTIPLGGDNVTKDISICLRTPYKKAEEIKKLYGAATISHIQHDQPIVIDDINGRINKQISQRLLVTIIEPRVEEIFQYIDLAIREAGYADLLPAGVILTGGTSLLSGIASVAEQVFRLPVKIGRLLYADENEVLDPNYLTAVGLAKYAMHNNEYYLKPMRRPLSDILAKVREFFA